MVVVFLILKTGVVPSSSLSARLIGDYAMATRLRSWLLIYSGSMGFRAHLKPLLKRIAVAGKERCRARSCSDNT